MYIKLIEEQEQAKLKGSRWNNNNNKDQGRD
jgi:hypothetical protein